MAMAWGEGVWMLRGQESSCGKPFTQLGVALDKALGTNLAFGWWADEDAQLLNVLVDRIASPIPVASNYETRLFSMRDYCLNCGSLLEWSVRMGFFSDPV